MKRTSSRPSFASIVQRFFTQRLIQQQQASPRTVAAYRDTFRLLLSFLEARLSKRPEALTIADLDTSNILAFLNDLEQRRKNSIRTRNTRLATIRSFLKFAAACDPESLDIAQRVLAIPWKRFSRRLVGYLTKEEVEAILRATEGPTWSSQRDRMMFALLYNTGIRVSELVSLRVADVRFCQTPIVLVQGKGRKERSVPLWKSTCTQLKAWMRHINPEGASPLFPNSRDKPLTRSGVESRLRRAVRLAAIEVPSLSKKRISPHTFRHTTAMHLLEAGVDVTVIAVWLGHEHCSTTHQYVEASLSMKRKALDKLKEPSKGSNKFRPSDGLLRFLNSL